MLEREPTIEAAGRRGRAAPAAPVAALAAGAVLCVAVFLLYRVPGNPPGFHHDEASLAYNAYTIAHTGRDQDGGLMPLYLVSYKDYKSTPFVYLLAGVFRVVGPSIAAARELGAVLVFTAALLLGLLAWRLTRSAIVSVAAVVLDATTPWLYELSRTAFEAVLVPAALLLALFAVLWSHRSARPLLLRAVAVGSSLGLLVYVYAAGRLLAPLYAVGLLVLAGRGRWRWLVSCWAAFAAALIPLGVYWLRHPGSLTARYQDTTFIHPGMSIPTIAKDAAWNYVRDVSPWHWVASGDPKPYIHTWGVGQLFGSVVMLAAAGAVLELRRRPIDRWWLFVLAALLLSPIPAALTVDRHHALRLLPLPVLLLVVAIPGAEWLTRRVRERSQAGYALRAVAAVLLLGVAVQFAWFEREFRSRGPNRTEFFEAQVPALLDRAFAAGGPVYIDYDDRYAQTVARWYAVTHGLPASLASVLADGGIPPAGAMVFGRTQACDYACSQLAAADTFWIAKAVGPKPS